MAKTETLNKLILESKVETDETTERIGQIFDYEFDGISREEIIVPDFPKDFQIGLIVGSSGSGKSTILKNVWGG